MSATVVLVLRGLITMLLYLFIGSMIYILWRNTFSPKEHGESARSIIFDISYENLNADLEFTDTELFIGRDSNAQISIPLETVSNLHARIFRKKGAWWIEDLQSTNGTFLNSVKVVSPTALETNDLIQCGESEILVKAYTD